MLWETVSPQLHKLKQAKLLPPVARKPVSKWSNSRQHKLCLVSCAGWLEQERRSSRARSGTCTLIDAAQETVVPR